MNLQEKLNQIEKNKNQIKLISETTIGDWTTIVKYDNAKEICVEVRQVSSKIMKKRNFQYKDSKGLLPLNWLEEIATIEKELKNLILNPPVIPPVDYSKFTYEMISHNGRFGCD